MVGRSTRVNDCGKLPGMSALAAGGPSEREVPMRRWLASLGVLFAVVVVSLAGAAWKTPRTPWGEPDLQGVWSYASLTPLERPSSQVGRKTLTDAEVAALDQEALTG